MSSWGVVARTLAHVLPAQVFNRPLRKIRRRFARPVAVPQAAMDPDVRRVLGNRVPFPVLETDKPVAQETADPIFDFLNRSVDLTPPIDWSAVDAPALWRYNLNYCGFLERLPASAREAICDDWIQQNPPFDGVGWDAYPTSLRIINWTKYAPPTPSICASLYTQASYLSGQLETHLLGNHLLENARALLFAGSYFSDLPAGGQWVERALRIYRRELDEQVLPDGGHFERSPMYHALVLEGVLDVINLLSPSHPELRRFVRTAQKMSGYLAGMTHPDGEIALLNDAVVGVAPAPSSLRSYFASVAGCAADGSESDQGSARLPMGLSSFRDSGYYCYRRNPFYFVIDAGSCGPDYLPAHAHADIFSFELSRPSGRWIVDTGVYEYAAGDMRDYCRSTRAHNSTTVDELDQLEVWGEFRVGRRARPFGVTFDEAPFGFGFAGTFSGYRQVIGDDVVHHRRVDLEKSTLRIVDSVSGSSQHTVASRLHLHPAVSVQPRGEDSLELTLHSDRCLLTTAGGTLTVAEGWYCPRFGEKTQNAVVELSAKGRLPAELRFKLEFADQ